jgi:hypothetical protein
MISIFFLAFFIYVDAGQCRSELSSAEYDVGESRLFSVNSLSPQLFCPESDKSCQGGFRWASRIDIEGSVIVDKLVVFLNEADCESFVEEWNTGYQIQTNEISSFGPHGGN